VDRQDEEHCFRLQKDRVYYVRLSLARAAAGISRTDLASIGTCFGKFTKTGKFKLHVTCLDFLSQYAKVRRALWVGCCAC
jgi:ribosome biogenesis protein Nip4